MSTISEFPIPKSNSEQPEKTEQTFKLTTQTVNGIKYPLLQSHSLHGTYQRMLNYLDNSGGYLGVNLVGHSGSGKTTIVKSFEAWLCKNGHNFNFHWFKGKDMQNLDTIIERLEKGLNHVIVMDDSSFANAETDKGKLQKIMSKFTTIRHIVKGKVICIFIFHYLHGLDRFYRAVPFAIYTSINAEEMHTFQQMYKAFPASVRNFAKLYRNSALYGYFTHNLGSWDGENKLTYQTRIARPLLISESNWLHQAVSFAETCNCGRHETKQQFKGNVKDIADSLLATTPTAVVNSVLGYYIAVRKGSIRHLQANQKTAWKKLSVIEDTVNIDFEELKKEVESRLTRKTKHSLKNSYKQEEKDLVDLLSKNPN